MAEEISNSIQQFRLQMQQFRDILSPHDKEKINSPQSPRPKQRKSTPKYQSSKTDSTLPNYLKTPQNLDENEVTQISPTIHPSSPKKVAFSPNIPNFHSRQQSKFDNKANPRVSSIRSTSGHQRASQKSRKTINTYVNEPRRHRRRTRDFDRNNYYSRASSFMRKRISSSSSDSDEIMVFQSRIPPSPGFHNSFSRKSPIVSRYDFESSSSSDDLHLSHLDSYRSRSRYKYGIPSSSSSSSDEIQFRSPSRRIHTVLESSSSSDDELYISKARALQRSKASKFTKLKLPKSSSSSSSSLSFDLGPVNQPQPSSELHSSTADIGTQHVVRSDSSSSFDFVLPQLEEIEGEVVYTLPVSADTFAIDISSSSSDDDSMLLVFGRAPLDTASLSEDDIKVIQGKISNILDDENRQVLESTEGQFTSIPFDQTSPETTEIGLRYIEAEDDF